MTTKAMANTVAIKPMISDDIPAANSTLLADSSIVLNCSKNKDKKKILIIN